MGVPLHEIPGMRTPPSNLAEPMADGIERMRQQVRRAQQQAQNPQPSTSQGRRGRARGRAQTARQTLASHAQGPRPNLRSYMLNGQIVNDD